MESKIRERGVGSDGHEPEIPLSQFSSSFLEILFHMDSFEVSHGQTDSAVVVEDRTELGRVRLQIFLTVVLVVADRVLDFGTVRDVISRSTAGTTQKVEIRVDVSFHFPASRKWNWVCSEESLVDAIGHGHWIFEPYRLDEVSERSPIGHSLHTTSRNAQLLLLGPCSPFRKPPVLGSEGGLQCLLKVLWISVTTEHQGFV